MKLILNDHIENLGERGDSVVVKAGYANNFLLPKNLAYHDTPGNRRRFEQEQTSPANLPKKASRSTVSASASSMQSRSLGPLRLWCTFTVT